MYNNVRSLLSKVDELGSVSDATKPDIIASTTIFLIMNLFCQIISYSDWTEIDMVVASLLCSVLLQGGPHGLEFLSLSIVLQPLFTKFCLCLFYRPPSSSVSIFDNLCTTLQIVNPAIFSTFVFLGDFNVNFCNPEHFLMLVTYWIPSH